MSKKTTQPPEKQLDIHDEAKLIAFSLRYKGNTYDQIAEALPNKKYSVFTLQQYFRPNGLWYDEYRSWAASMTQDTNEQLKDMFTAQAVHAMQQVTNLAHGRYVITIEDEKGNKRVQQLSVKDSTALKANQDILDRAGFKPAERIEFEAESKAEEAAKWFENRKKQTAGAGNEK